MIAVHRSLEHTFSKGQTAQIELLAGMGVARDCHSGAQVRHRSRVAADPTQPNLRQVHLIQSELFGELGESGFAVAPGDLGENITTGGLDLLSLPTGSVLRIGTRALVALTGLRDPCKQIDDFQKGLLVEVLERGVAGEILRKAGVMGVVVLGGSVQPGDPIEVAIPPEPPVPLEVV